MKPRRIAIAIIIKDDKILIGKKPEIKHPANMGGMWHFPGGKIEKNEQPEEAVIREIKEETNLDIKIIEKFQKVNLFTINNIQAEMHFFLCKPITMDLKQGSDLEKVKWVDKKEVLNNLNPVFVSWLTDEVIDYLNK